MKNFQFKELRLVNPDYTYIAKKIKEFDDISYNMIYNEAMQKMFLDETLEIQHEAMIILKDRGYIEYERRTTKNKK